MTGTFARRVPDARRALSLRPASSISTRAVPSTMPTDSPVSSRSVRRRAAATPANIPSGPPLRSFVPYVVAGAVVVALGLLIRTPRYAPIGAMGIVVVVGLVMAWLGLGVRSTLTPEDRLRWLLPMLATFVLLLAGAIFAAGIFPPRPTGVVHLAASAAEGDVAISGPAGRVWLTVTGGVVPTATVPASYFLSVEHDGRTERVDGALHMTRRQTRSELHGLGLAGPGTYRVRLEQTSTAVALPLFVRVDSRPLSLLAVLLLGLVLAVGVVAADVMIWQRDIEPSFAPAMLLVLGAALYFHRVPFVTAAELPSALIAAGVVGALAGGLGGELLARLARSLLPG